MKGKNAAAVMSITTVTGKNAAAEATMRMKAAAAAIIMVTPSKPMVIEPVKEIPQLGRFAIRDMGTTVAAGMCMSVVPR